MTLLLRPPAQESVRLAPLLVGLAACRALDRAAHGPTARLKWPNDVLLGERKVAGILCEAAAGGAVVAGVGVNVRQRLADFPPELRERAVSLEMAAGRSVSRAAVAGALITEVRALLARPPVRLEAAIAEEVARRDALLGARVHVQGGPTGIVRGIDAAGRLRIEVAPGVIELAVAGSVTMTPAPGSEELPAGS
jgi:BirA family biotin operon repressor/biotin-[acetyl-CoA-carboxylase] ligase